MDELSGEALELVRQGVGRGVVGEQQRADPRALCIGTDGTAIEIAKRRAVLAPGEPFFAYERAIGPLVAACAGWRARSATRPGC